MAFNVSPWSNWSLHESDFDVERFEMPMYSIYSQADQLSKEVSEGDSHSEFGDDHKDSTRSLQSSSDSSEENDEDDSKSDELTTKRKRCEKDEPAENTDDGEKKRREADWSGRQMA